MSETRRGTIAVTGASGFIGTHLTRALRDAGWTVRALVRSTSELDRLRARGYEVALADVRDRPSLAAGLAGCLAAIHLVAIIRESGSATYESVNRQGTANVAAAAKTAGVDRLVHLSALGAGPSSTRYLASRWAGEEEVRRSGIRHVIFRPSFIMGPGGGAAQQFAAVVRYGPWYPFQLMAGGGRLFGSLAALTPVIPVLGSGRTRFMPVDRGDVFDAVLQSLERADVLGETFEIGGPDVVTYDQIMDAVARVLRLRRGKIHLPPAPAGMFVRLFKLLPNPPITLDEFETLLIDNVCDNTKVVRTFRLRLRPFVESLHEALRGD
ncbi:MAG: NAD(P)H-binding protein [Armatimonadetes bacterium]|nr:NAD(P)H-binding protein [Armatimonadota bacterium]MBI2973662.1 NAD(P)H-binding protein [Armatimonadota bacterium]